MDGLGRFCRYYLIASRKEYVFMSELTDKEQLVPFITSGLESSLPVIEGPTCLAQRRQSVSAESVDPNEYNEDYFNAGQNALHPPPGSNSRKIILDRLRTMLIFVDLQLDVLAEIVSLFTEEKFSEGTIILTEGEGGETANKFHVVESGSLSVSSGGHLFAQMGPGSSFNEISLLHDSIKTFTIKAVTDVKAWTLDRILFKEVMAHQLAKKREFLRGVIKGTKPLQCLDEEDQVKLVSGLQSVSFNAREAIMREDEEATNFYIISQGEIMLSMKGVPMTSLGKGNIFGEFALLGQSLNVVTAVARTHVQLETLDKHGFERLLGVQAANDFRHKAKMLSEKEGSASS